MQVFRDQAKLNEMHTFIRMLGQIKDFSDDEKAIVREEIESQNNMLLMIFRFFLQSGEFEFFVRRVKNVVITKASLKQIKSNEKILNSRVVDERIYRMGDANDNSR